MRFTAFYCVTRRFTAFLPFPERLNPRRATRVLPLGLALAPAGHQIAVEDLALHGLADGGHLFRFHIQRAGDVVVFPARDVAAILGDGGLRQHVDVNRDGERDGLLGFAGDGSPFRIVGHFIPDAKPVHAHTRVSRSIRASQRGGLSAGW